MPKKPYINYEENKSLNEMDNYELFTIAAILNEGKPLRKMIAGAKSWEGIPNWGAPFGMPTSNLLPLTPNFYAHNVRFVGLKNVVLGG